MRCSNCNCNITNEEGYTIKGIYLLCNYCVDDYDLCVHCGILTDEWANGDYFCSVCQKEKQDEDDNNSQTNAWLNKQIK